MRNTFAIHNVKLCLFERRSDFIFNNFNASTATNHIVTVFQSIHSTHVNTNSRIELQRTTTGSSFRVAEHNANFFTNLVDENSSAFRFCNQTSQFTQRLAHQTSLQTNMGVAHFAFDFCTRNQSRNGVNYDNINCTTTNERVANFQCLFAIVRLGNQKIVYVNAQFTSIFRVKCMFSIDERRITAHFLSFCNHM